MAKKRDNDEIPEELQILLQLAIDKAAEVVEDLEDHFGGRLEIGKEGQVAIANAIYKALDAAFTKKAKE